MRFVENPHDFAKQMEHLRQSGKRLAFVPTMGALHDGHLKLVEEAQKNADVVALSIFVNPLQFGPKEDFARYPRDIEGDTQKANAADFIFAPKAEDFYASDFQSRVEVGKVGADLDGARRPGHFVGVATVVLKLLNLSRAHVAFFGEKDFQQLLVIKQMARDLSLPVEIIGVPTVREADGLAMSSRNRYLDAGERKRALALSRALEAVRAAAAKGEKKRDALEALGAKIVSADAELDYFEVRDAETLAHPVAIAKNSRALVAAFVGKTRLIDNCAI